MIRLAVTVWFTVAALLGPGLCCCLKVSAAEPVKKPAKSCCHTPTDESPKTPAKPEPCPCQQAKAAVEYAPAEKPTADPGAMPTVDFVGVGPAESVTAACPAPVAADAFVLTGRQRLALFHVLTC
jgi:hypothetical protein